jgi:hypothetical protein
MTLLLCRKEPGDQSQTADTFQGGQPKLPSDVTPPRCSICQDLLTFFFQVGFSAPHPWRGHSLALFACTCCADESSLIPEMLTGQLAGAKVPEEFLSRYATNFRALVFETTAAQVQHQYPPRVLFAPLVACQQSKSYFARAGGEPSWVLEDESPSEVAGSEATFLLQLRRGLKFPAHPDAPPQVDIGLDGSQEAAEPGKYELFVGNEVYFYGTPEPSPLVYVFTQVD